MSGQKPITTVRFPPSLALAARRMADRDGMSLSAWIRRLIDQEIGRRDGICPTCGQRTHPA
jgi:predicted HicB family RNase H-like nuclease